jgi:hypothetical protein
VSRRLGIDSKSVFYGGFVWARRALTRRKRRFLARAVTTDDYGIVLTFLCLMIFPVTVYLLVATGWATTARGDAVLLRCH